MVAGTAGYSFGNLNIPGENFFFRKCYKYFGLRRQFLKKNTAGLLKFCGACVLNCTHK